MGLPFIGIRGLLCTDILKHRPDLTVVQNPFNPGEDVVVAQPIRPDVAAFHALKADRWGNAITPGLRDDLMMARAARRVVVTAEEVVEGELSVLDATGYTFLPAIDVDVVAHAPYGAHPCSCGDLYPVADDHCREYVEAAADVESFKAYLERYVFQVDGHQGYLELVGKPVDAGNGASS